MLLVLTVLFLVAPREQAPNTADAVTESPTHHLTRVAVLPLASYSPDPDDEYFADGMTEELISRLSKLRDLRVIARTSVMQYKDTEKTVGEIARDLQVGTVLEGSVRMAGNHVRISVQLVDPKSQERLWSEDYDAELADVLVVQSEIAERVAQALNVTMPTDERRPLADRRIENPEVYRLYLQGRYFWNKRDTENSRKRCLCFSRRSTGIRCTPRPGRVWRIATRCSRVTTLKLEPQFGLTHLDLVLLHVQAKRYDQALEAVRVLQSLWGDSPQCSESLDMFTPFRAGMMRQGGYSGSYAQNRRNNPFRRFIRLLFISASGKKSARSHCWRRPSRRRAPGSLSILVSTHSSILSVRNRAFKLY